GHPLRRGGAARRGQPQPGPRRAFGHGPGRRRGRQPARGEPVARRSGIRPRGIAGHPHPPRLSGTRPGVPRSLRVRYRHHPELRRSLRAGDPAMIDVEAPRHLVRDAVARAIAEDLGPLGDLTAALLAPDSRAAGVIAARAAGVLAGTACVTETFAQLDPDVVVRFELADGAPLEPATVVATINGPARSVLTGERTALNFLCHLSGVATLTRR